jgi:hypothetical protein
MFEVQEYKVTRQDLSELVCASRREGSLKGFQTTGRCTCGVLSLVFEQEQEILTRVLRSEGGCACNRGARLHVLWFFSQWRYRGREAAVDMRVAKCREDYPKVT